jgi:chitinase
MQWVKDNNIGGGFTWDTSLDDFNGKFCNEGKFPLITSAIDTLTGSISSSSTTTFSSTIASSSTAPPSSTAITSSASSTTTAALTGSSEENLIYY